jgi:hypothetical protein
MAWAAVLLLMLCLAGGIYWTLGGAREITLQFPEEHAAREAHRHAPENAMLLLAEAVSALPQKPGADTAAAWVQSRTPESASFNTSQPAGTTLAALCGVELPSDGDAINQYVNDSTAAWEMLKSALQQPHCLALEHARFLGESTQLGLIQLGRNLVALGRVRFEASPEPDALAPLFDAVRLARMLSREQDLLRVSHAIESPAWQQIRYLAQSGGKPGLLANAIGQVGIGYLPRREVLRTLWLDVDDLIGPRKNAPGLRSKFGRFRAFNTGAVQRLVLRFQARQAEMMEIADQAPPRMRLWLDANAMPQGVVDETGVCLQIAEGLHLAGEISSEFAATLLTLALEAYRDIYGEYPQKLDALLPHFYATPPVDPYTLQTYGYRPKSNGYVIYSFGENLMDDGADLQKDRIIVEYTRAESDVAAEAEAEPETETVPREE